MATPYCLGDYVDALIRATLYKFVQTAHEVIGKVRKARRIPPFHADVGARFLGAESGRCGCATSCLWDAACSMQLRLMK